MTQPWEMDWGQPAQLPMAAPQSDAPTRITVRPQDAQGAKPWEMQWGSGPSGYPDIGRGQALATGALQGVTANFGDELSGVMAAGDNAPAMLRLPVGAARLGAEFGSGQAGPATDAYEQAREVTRANTQAAQEQYPGTYTAGNIGGAVAVPGGALARGATVPARMLGGMALGSGYGAMSGIGEGVTPEQRAMQGLTGGAVGAGVGLVAPPLVEGAIRAGQAATAPIVNSVRGAFNPASEASRRVVGAVERDRAADPAAVNRLTAPEYLNAQAEGQPVSVMDLGGETTRALARSAANTSPEGRAALNMTINDRFEGQSGRIADWFRGAFNFPNAHAQQQAIDQAEHATNNAAYRRAYRDGSAGVWSPELERLAGSDAVIAAMRKAASAARDESIVGGYGAMNPRITFTQDGRIQFNRGPNGVPTYPDLQYWDLVRRELSDAARRAGFGTSEARRLNNFARALNAELDHIVPSYRAARQGATQFFGAENALEAGQNYVMQNFATPGVRQALANMSPLQRQLFQDGFVSRFIETIERTGDRRNVLNQIAANPAAREKLNVALGPQRATELEARLRLEGIMDLARGAVQGNSTTARQLVELGLAGGAMGLGGIGTYHMDPTTMTIAAVMGALSSGGRRIDQRVARHVATMLTSHDPAVLQQGVQIVARNQRLMGTLRATDQRLSVVGSQQARGVPAIQGPMRAAADQEQQQPPGAIQQ